MAAQGSRAGRSATARASSASRFAWDGTGMAWGLVWLLVVAVPLVLMPTARDAFALPKLMLAEWLALASVLVLVLAAALRRSRGGHSRASSFAHPAGRAALVLVLPVVAAAALSWAFTTHRAHSTSALADLAVGGIALWAWASAFSADRLRALLGWLLVPAVILAAVGVAQYHGFSGLGVLGDEEAIRIGVTSLAGNPGHLGSFLAFALVLGQALLPRLRGGARWATLAGLAVGAYALAVSLTLTSVVAVLVGSAVVWWTLLPRRRALAALAGVVVAGLVLVTVVTPLRERVGAVMERAGDGRVNILLSGRLDGWRTALWMFEQDPWTGVGHGAYVTEFNTAKLDLLDRGVPFYRSHVLPTFANAHQELLEVAAEWGVPGIGALLWLLWVVGRAVGRLAAARRTKADGGGPAALSDAALARGGLVVLVVLALFYFPFRIALTAFPALLWLAWLLRRASEAGAPAARAARDDAGDGAGDGAAKRRPAALAVAWGLALLMLGAVVLQTMRAHDLLQASRMLKVVEQVTVQFSARGQIPAPLLWHNLRVLRQAEAMAPASTAVVVAQASHHLLLDRPQQARGLYRRALTMEPRPETWLNLGRAQWADGLQEEARESWLTAVRLDRNMQLQLPDAARASVVRRLRGLQRSAGSSPDDGGDDGGGGEDADSSADEGAGR